MNHIDVNTLDDFTKLRYAIDGKKLPLISHRFEDGFICLEYEGISARVHGHWEEPVRTRVSNWLASQSPELFSALKQQRFIFGKNPIERVVAIEPNGNEATLFLENEEGVFSETIPNPLWILSPRPLNASWQRLEGDLYYKYIKLYDNVDDYRDARKALYKMDTFSIWDDKEAAMVYQGITFFKGMKVSDVSVLSFDIEATGLAHDASARVLCISNTYRKNGIITKKLFAVDEYDCDRDMLEAWCEFVRECDPSVLVGHNVFGYDLPYMNYCAQKHGTQLLLGRDASALRFEERTSKFRKDGSQDYDYHRCHIYGRQIVDTMFVAYHYDYSRKYESYGLKPIIKHEGLEREGRQFYDASKIGENWHIPEERVLIKKYVEDDSDDSLKLYDLMIPSYFYVSQNIPKTFQVINYSSTGTQLNAFLIRSYLQDGHSIPKADEPRPFRGAISFAIPGIYKNILKLDFANLYPNIIRQYNIFSKKKDPYAHLSVMTDYFTKERLKNKTIAKQTGDPYYSSLEQSQKLVANSIYGLLGAKLNFNYPEGAAKVTEIGRELLTFSILWSTGKPIEHWIDIFDKKVGNEKSQE